MGFATPDLLAEIENESAQQSDVYECRILHSLLWGKFYLTEGELVKAKNNLFKAEELAQSFVKTTQLTIRKNDLYSYVLCEIAQYYRMLYDHEHARKNLLFAKFFAESEAMMNLIDMTLESYKYTRFYNEVSEGDINVFNTYLDYFRHHRIPYALAQGLYFRFAINADSGKYDEAYNDYFDGTALAEKLDLDTLTAAFQIGLGYMMQKQKEYQQALEHYHKAFELTHSWLRKSQCLENISTIYEHYRLFEKSVEYQKQSLEICEKHGVICNIPADCYYLGKSYENNFHDLRQAHYYYKKGHDLAVQMRDEGIHLTGFNQRIISQYGEFLSKYFAEDAIHEYNQETYFGFAINQNWRRIKDTFQYSLLMYHKNRCQSLNQMLASLKLKMSTLQAIQRRLNKSGFEIPDTRYVYGRQKEAEIDPGLNLYLRQNQHLDWKTANSKFEREVICMLMKHMKNNKTALSNQLEISYTTIISLTKTPVMEEVV